MKSDELRNLYLRFFEEREHKIIPSSSLIPYGDPTLLLTSAGMVQFKPYFTGKAVPLSPRAVSCQKCFRTNDIESVGDPTHLTFFEMLGNFSFGDYFKKEAIDWAWDFVLKYLKLPDAKLWVTIFYEDDVAFDLWRGQNVPAERIVRLGEKDNFWGPAGTSGPCGPCSEIHYDLGEKYGCGKADCKPGCDCRRFTEIWNLVFTEFNQAEDGTRTKLPKPNIDTGMGFERTLMILQGKPTPYETDLFASVMVRIGELAGKRYEGTEEASDHAMRVLADHGRAVAFLIADGVMPGKEGRGYVLRRILRRAEYFGETLAYEKPFMVTVAEEIIKNMGHVYPELTTNRHHILNVVKSEVDGFRKVLPVGRGMLEDIITRLEKKNGPKTVSGSDAFMLHDTYGFPIDLTREIASRRGFTVDMPGFELEMEKQRERAKSAQKFYASGTGMTDVQLDLPPTIFAGYEKLLHDSRILAILVDGESVGVVHEGQEAGIVLEATPFYGEMGGQVGDTGEIESETGHFSVTNTMRTRDGEIIIHRGKIIRGSLAVDDAVQAEVGTPRRVDIARNHTATHLLQYALRKVLGQQIQQRGSLVTPERFRFDFSQLVALSPEQLQEVQRIVNELIRQDLEVYAESLSYKQAVAEGAIALFDEKYGENVRALKIGKPPVSIELCGGTHIHSTGRIGFFQILSETSIGSGLRRIEAVTGRGAEELMEKLVTERREIAKAVGASGDDLLEKLKSTLDVIEQERKLRQATERELARKVAESLLTQVETVKGINVISAEVPSLPPQAMREISDFLRDKLKSVIIVLGTVYEDRPSFLAVVTQDLVAKGYHAGNIIKQVAQVTGGSGGGRPNMAQAGGKDKSKLDEALKLVRTLI
ncbi:MAG: alanine--tRNA ligase [Dehalococcoidia bacterium]|nr:alanine--tRNA ligase [Dehalococcoidia bacterium]